MKRFIFSVLVVSIFFLGLGALVERTGASFKSDERALELVRKARVAIGGEAAISAVQGMVITGRTTQTIKINGVDRTETGETEIAMQLPDKMMKMVKMGDGNGGGEAHQIISRQVDVIVTGDAKEHMKVKVDASGKPGEAHRIVIKKDDGTVQELTGDEAVKFIAKEHPGAVDGERTIILKKDDGTIEKLDAKTAKTFELRKGGDGTATVITKDGKTFEMKEDVVFAHGAGGAHHGASRSNEMLRTTLALLLTAPQGLDVEYTLGAPESVEGRSCNVVVATFAGDAYRIYLDASSNLPVAISYKGMPMPKVMTFERTAGAPAPKGDVVTFERKMKFPGELVDIQVRFADFRSVGGLQLPFKWTQVASGNVDETFDVANYEINPANLGEKFQNQKVMVRTAKPDTK